MEIENKSIIKPFLGGYKFKSSFGVLEYHDAFTQTGPPKQNIKFNTVCKNNQSIKEIDSSIVS